MKRRDVLLMVGGFVASAGAAGGGLAYAMGEKLTEAAKASLPEVPATDGHGSAHTTSTGGATDGHGDGASSEAPHAEGPHWDYEGELGPGHWSDIDPQFAVCNAGGAQSPVNIAGAMNLPGLNALTASYGPTKLKISHNGHTIQVDYDKGSLLMVESKKYELLQFHFHTPSEHLVDKHDYPMELHLVHKSSDGALAVIGLLISEGASNPFLGRFWSRLPKEKGDVPTELVVNIGEILPSETIVEAATAKPTGSPISRIAQPTAVPGPTRSVPAKFASYYHYAGSLTTPPCSETVSWFVLKKPIEASKEQIAAFRTLFTNNARPVQPLGPRLILQTAGGSAAAH